MSRRKLAQRKKRRTREHVIADLSVNHVERHALLCGCSVERVVHDYGIDLRVSTYDQDGEVENGEIMFQLKATDHLKVISGGNEISFRLERADLRTWLGEFLPVILVVYDAVLDRGYWLYVQAFFEGRPFSRAVPRSTRREGQPRFTVRIPTKNVLDQTAMQHLARCKANIWAQIWGKVHHEDKDYL